MSEIFVTQTDDALLSANAAAVKRAVEAQRRKETIQSAVTALFGFGVVLALLALIALLPTSKEVAQIVTYQDSSLEEPPPLKLKELTRNAQPRPPGASSSMAKVIASNIVSPIFVPIPEVSNPEGLFGMEEAFGPGFGSSEGDGSGGGGTTFFGSHRKGRRVVFCVDFSGSMEQSTSGGTRISALKNELVDAIKKLSSNMSVSVVFFSTTGWTIETEGPDYFSNGWSGVGKAPPVLWYPANDRLKAEVIRQVQKMPVKGGTNWYPPLKMACTMTPQPDVIYLLSDGAPRDGTTVLSEMEEINPNGIPIDTIAFELPGTAAGQLRDIASDTGGKFVLIYKGKRFTGPSAERYTSSSYDEN